mmetsp:Transcript_17167/g.35258  ORF Transcript_17167/g.35258 Transcript_17167/m.35258 type:complete len:233 (+) Transcript_17167:359-1057(+)
MDIPLGAPAFSLRIDPVHPGGDQSDGGEVASLYRHGLGFDPDDFREAKGRFDRFAFLELHQAPSLRFAGTAPVAALLVLVPRDFCVDDRSAPGTQCVHEVHVLGLGGQKRNPHRVRMCGVFQFSDPNRVFGLCRSSSSIGVKKALLLFLDFSKGRWGATRTNRVFGYNILPGTFAGRCRYGYILARALGPFAVVVAIIFAFPFERGRSCRCSSIDTGRKRIGHRGFHVVIGS